MPLPPETVATPPALLDPGDVFEFDPWVPPEARERTIAWARAEHTVTPQDWEEYYPKSGTEFPPWGIRPEINTCTSYGGTWHPDPSYETSNGLGGRCDLPDGTRCGALDRMRGHCPVDPPVEPPVEPDPIDPFPVDPIPPVTPANGQADAWLLLVAAIALLG